MPRFKKGSKEAKAYMAQLRGMIRKPYRSAARHVSAVRPMARRRRVRYALRGRRGGGKSIMRTLFKWFRVGAAVAPGVGVVMERGLTPEAAKGAVSIYTGYNMDTGQFDWSQLARGWLPLLAVTAVTWGIGKISGIIRKV